MASRAQELDTHLRDHPEDLPAWESYGDLLAAAGDQRAKLIALELAIRDGHTELRRELRALQENLKQASGLTVENGIGGAFHFSAFRLQSLSALQSLSGRAVSALERLLDVPQLWGPELELQIDASEDLARYVPVLLRARPSALRIDGANAAAAPWHALPRAVLSELEEFSLFLDRSSSLEPAEALLDVLENALSPTRLARLGLWDCKLDDAGLQRLARAPAFRTLERLTLGYENPGPVGVAALSHPNAFPKLSALGFCVADFQTPPLGLLTSALARHDCATGSSASERRWRGTW